MEELIAHLRSLDVIATHWTKGTLHLQLPSVSTGKGDWRPSKVVYLRDVCAGSTIGQIRDLDPVKLDEASQDDLEPLPESVDDRPPYEMPLFNFNGDVNRFANGRWKYIPHGLDDNRDIPCIEDFASDVGRKHWKRYHVERNAEGKVLREGPMPFRDESEKRSYEQLTGMVAAGAGDLSKQEHPHEKYFKKWPHLRHQEPVLED